MFLTGETAIWHHQEKTYLINWAATKIALLKRFSSKILLAITCRNLANIVKSENKTFIDYLHRFENAIDQIGAVSLPLDELLDFFILGITSHKRWEIYQVL